MATWRRSWVLLIFAALLGGVVLSHLRQCNALQEEDERHLDEAELAELLENGEDADPADGSDVTGLAEDEFGDFDEEGDEGGNGVAIDEKDVVVLGSDNFTQFVDAHNYVLVEFYAPWCGHCQALVPEYAEAATSLKGEVSLAKVDATVHDELGQTYGVAGYPTLLFFIDGVHKPYTGQRTKDEIVKWVKRKTGPSVETITSTDDAELLLDSDNPIAVAYLEKLEGPEADELISAARQEDAVMFYMTSNVEVARVFSLEKKQPALVLLKKENEKDTQFDGRFERKSLANFVYENKLPLVTTFNRETASSIFESDIKRQVILFVFPEEYEALSPVFEEASKSFRGKLIFVHVNLGEEESAKILEFFGITGDHTSVMGFVAEEDGRKYLLEGAVTVDALKTFGEEFLADRLKPFLKSQPIPEKNDDDVKVVVGHNFDEIVLDESKDVLLEIYAPWCGHCQALEPTYKKLGKRLQGVESLVIAKMDGTANEHVRAKSDGYPTLLLFPAGKKSFEPITVDADRTVKGLYKFLKKNSAIPFTLPKSADNKANTSKSSTATVEETSPVDEPKDEL